jgi:1-acyl-sn-glycerol-3-phosphate acyltransferase
VTNPVHGHPRPPDTRSRLLWTVAPPVIGAIGRVFFDMRIDKPSALPSPPFVIAANHYSHFDPPVIGAALDVKVRYMALEDLFGPSRVLDWLITGFGAIPTPRQRNPIRAVRTALSALDAGEVVGVFPEASRVTHWGTLPPKRGASWLALRSGVPLVPVAVVGTGRVFGLENRLRRAPIRVVVGDPIGPDGLDVAELTNRWSRWISSQIARFPESEVSGPRRSQLDSI